MLSSLLATQCWPFEIFLDCFAIDEVTFPTRKLLNIFPFKFGAIRPLKVFKLYIILFGTDWQND